MSNNTPIDPAEAEAAAEKVAADKLVADKKAAADKATAREQFRAGQGATRRGLTVVENHPIDREGIDPSTGRQYAKEPVQADLVRSRQAYEAQQGGKHAATPQVKPDAKK